MVGPTAAVLWGAVEPPEQRTDRQHPDRQHPDRQHPDRQSSCDDLVEVAAEHAIRPMPGVRLRRDRLRPDEVVEHEGVRVSTPVRTAYDVGRRSRTVDAVVAVEGLHRSRGVTVDDVRDLARTYPHARGLVRLAAALALVEPAASSAFESRLRIDLRLAGLRAPVVGHVREADDGRGVRAADLAWPEERCALLCDRDDRIATLMASGLVADGWTVHRVGRNRYERDRILADRLVETIGHMLRGARRRRGLDRDRERQEALRGVRPRRRREVLRVWDEPAEAGGRPVP